MIKPTRAQTPSDYIEQIDEPRRADISALHAFIMKTVPKLEPRIQAGMIGYGSYHYKYASGREGDWPIIALASQKSYISVYVCGSEDGETVAEKHKHELPKASIGKSCIRFKRLSEIDLKVLGKIIKAGASSMAKAHRPY